jgi:hypothetical protein
MTEITVTRTEYPDSLSIGRESKGGIIKVFFNADDLAGAQKRVDTAIRVREYLIEKLSGSGVGGP